MREDLPEQLNWKEWGGGKGHEGGGRRGGGEGEGK